MRRFLPVLPAPRTVSKFLFVPPPEEALALSDRATRGRKWILFGFFVLLWLVASGAQKFVMPSAEIMKELPQPAIVLIFVAGAVLEAVIGLIQLSGLWLAWADAIAPRNPRSPAAPFEFRGMRPAP